LKRNKNLTSEIHIRRADEFIRLLFLFSGKKYYADVTRGKKYFSINNKSVSILFYTPEFK
jgi:hypothetical protein